MSEYQASTGDDEVTPDDHREIAEEMRRAIALASGAAQRAALFVRGIKSQTRDLGPHERLPFNVVTSVREALLLLGHALRKGNCRAIFEPPAAHIELHGSPVRLGQVVTNLVENAIDASLAGGGGAITITVIQRDGAIDLRSPTAAPGSIRRSSTASSSRCSPPSPSVRARGSVSRSCTTSSPAISAGPFESTVDPGWARPSR